MEITEDRGVLVSTNQAEKSRASFDNQNVLEAEIARNANENQAAVAIPVIGEAPAAEAAPVAEAPAVEAAPANNQADLEQMMQQMTEAYSNGDTAKAEELSNAISEANKTLQKVA